MYVGSWSLIIYLIFFQMTLYLDVLNTATYLRIQLLHSYEQSYFVVVAVFVNKHYCYTDYDKMVLMLEGTTGKPSVYPETLVSKINL